MTTKQRVIKYLALAFAVFLIVSFALGIFEVLSSLLEMEVNKPVGTDYIYSYTIDDRVNELKISISAADLRIVRGDQFSVSTDNENVVCSENGSVFSLNDKEKFNVSSEGAVVLEVPADKMFDKVTVDAGAGEITVETLCASELSMNFGAGDFYADELLVTSGTYIGCAAGEFTVKSGSLKNLEMDMAVGDVALYCSLKGKTEINCGIGDIDINLPESLAEYRIEVDKGICSASLNGKTMEDEREYGNGSSEIEIDGAVGDIIIKTNG